MDNPNRQAGISHLALPKRILFIVLRLIFKLLYHQFAWTYDWVAALVSLGAWQNWVQSVLPYLEGPQVLEIGFGPGHLLASLHRKGITVFGLDESPQMITIARRRISKLNWRPRLVRGKAETLPYSADCFHQVVMTFPAEFILKEISLLEIKRVLVNGGRVVILPLAWITGHKPWEKAAAWFNQIIGEAPPWNEKVLEPMKNLGFDVTWEMIILPASRLVIIQLTKSLTP